MEGFLTSLALGGGILLALAVFVACWEYWRQSARTPWRPPATLPRAVSVDVDIDALPFAASDLHERHATLGAALGSMVRGPSDPVAASARSWVETRPMVAPGAAAEHEAH
jgi:hypothetical protein